MEKITYLLNVLRETDDKKYLLLKAIYDLPELSGFTGSEKDDYDIRDLAGEVARELDSIYNMLKLFDNGKNGDVKAYEDILVFFQNCFMDTFILGEKITLLKNEISLRGKIDSGRGEGLPGSAPEAVRKKIDREEFEKKINLFETKVNYEIAPRLRLFLTGVNKILFHEKIIFFIENSIDSGEQAVLEQKSTLIKNIMTTFAWIHNKINPRDFPKTGIREFFKVTLLQLGLTEILTSKTGIGGVKLDGIMDELSRDLDQAGGNADTVIPIPAYTWPLREPAETSDGTVPRLMALINELCSIGIDEKRMDEGLGAADLSMKTGVKNRFLFHNPGAFSSSLKSVSEYMNDSLIYVFSFLVGEIRKRSMSAESAVFLLDCVPMTEELIREYKKALAIAGDPANQTVTFLGGEVSQYVPMETAGRLMTLIKELCERLDAAFIECYIGIDNRYTGNGKVVLKKLKIVHEAFSNAVLKITRVLEKLK